MKKQNFLSINCILCIAIIIGFNAIAEASIKHQNIEIIGISNEHEAISGIIGIHHDCSFTTIHSNIIGISNAISIANIEGINFIEITSIGNTAIHHEYIGRIEIQRETSSSIITDIS